MPVLLLQLRGVSVFLNQMLSAFPNLYVSSFQPKGFKITSNSLLDQTNHQTNLMENTFVGLSK